MKKWILLLCIFLVGCQQSDHSAKQTSRVTIHVETKEGHPIAFSSVNIDRGFSIMDLFNGGAHTLQGRLTNEKGDFWVDEDVGQDLTLQATLSSGVTERTITVPDHPVTVTFVEKNPTSADIITAPVTIHMRTATGAPIVNKKITLRYHGENVQFGPFSDNMVTDSEGNSLLYLEIGEKVKLIDGNYTKEFVVPDNPSEVTFIEK